MSFDYAGQDKKIVKLVANEGAAIENKLIYGSVSGLKVDANDKPLSGAVMGLFAASETRFTKDTALLAAVSAEDGRFRFEKIPAGNWLVREIEQPKGFVLSEELFPVTVKEQGQVIEIKIANKLIRGSVTLTKYDADYPENKLSGAVFEVYRDVNGNKALDKDDVLLGTMEESSAGVYWMKNLEYGGVLIREKTAPEGFIPDEKAYYVEIDTDGKTYTVENEAGKGFINHALNAGACSKTHAQTVKNCPQDKILRAVQMSEIIDGNDPIRTLLQNQSGVKVSCSAQLCPLPESLYKKPKASMSFSGGSMFFFILSGHGVPFSVIAGDERSTERASA